jgi:hypothetical protein
MAVTFVQGAFFQNAAHIVSVYFFLVKIDLAHYSLVISGPYLANHLKR